MRVRTRFPVYSWPDGSNVELRIRAPGAVVSGGVPPEDASMLMVSFPDGTRIGLKLKKGSETNGPAKSAPYFLKKSWTGSDLPGANRKGNREKLFGFFSDLRLAQFGTSPTLIMNKNEMDCIGFLGPTFISDEVFEQRHEEARRRGSWKMHSPPFLGADVLAGSRVRLRPNQLWEAEWHDLEGDKRESLSATLEEAVDWLCLDAMVFPESQRAEWESANVERGTWLLPTAEEIEVFFILDEPLPFAWEYEELERWLADRT